MIPKHAISKLKASAFTLIECIVVISIIAILAVILLPALTRTRESALMAKSLSNLKQIAAAMHFYAADNSSEFPPADQWPKEPLTWGGILQVGGYLGDPSVGYGGSDLNRILVSPGDLKAMKDNTAWNIWKTYGYNNYALGRVDAWNRGALWVCRLVNISQPSKTIMVADSVSTATSDLTGSTMIYPTYSSSLQTYQIYPRYSGKATVVMVDGHVETLDSSDIKRLNLGLSAEGGINWGPYQGKN